MAYETLKSIITQNIKTNGQESITGAVLQQILLRMVDELGYTPAGDLATKEWVNTQLSDYASQTWVNNKLGDYLPLTGGTMTGNLRVNGSTTLAGGTLIIENVDTGTFLTHLGGSGNMYFEGAEVYQFDAEVYVQTQIYAASFVKIGGTSNQVLCADGSVKTLAELKAALNAI